MLEHYNNSGFKSFIYPTTNREGYETAVAIVKATFKVNDQGVLTEADKQRDIVMADVFRGDPATTSIQYESDLAIYKPGTDIIINGEAHAPKGRSVDRLEVLIEAGPLQKRIRVYGDRVWERFMGVGFLRKSRPVPFIRMPLVYEKAFGGVDAETTQDPIPKFDARNPVGCGYQVGFTCKAGTRLPNLEDPSALIHTYTLWGWFRWQGLGTSSAPRRHI
jgi:hypothetical protein